MSEIAKSAFSLPRDREVGGGIKKVVAAKLQNQGPPSCRKPCKFDRPKAKSEALQSFGACGATDVTVWALHAALSTAAAAATAPAALPPLPLFFRESAPRGRDDASSKVREHPSNTAQAMPTALKISVLPTPIALHTAYRAISHSRSRSARPCAVRMPRLSPSDALRTALHLLRAHRSTSSAVYTTHAYLSLPARASRARRATT